MRPSNLFAAQAASLAIGVLCAGGALAQTPDWAPEAPMPMARSEAVAVAAAGRVYVFTGNSPGNEANALTHQLETMNSEWSEKAPMPAIASHAGGATLGGKIYIVGGFVANVHVGAMDRVFEYDVNANTWRAMAPLPTPRGSPIVVAVAGKLHVIGGRDANKKTLTAHEVFTPASNSWTAAAPFPLARDHAGVAVVNGRIHVFGGRTDAQSDNTGRHDVYDPRMNVWTQAAPLTVPRSAGAAGFINGRIIYAGGECKDTAMQTTYDEVEAYDPMTDKWTLIGKMPSGRHAAASIALGPVLYIFGGNNGCGGNRPLAEALTLRITR